MTSSTVRVVAFVLTLACSQGQALADQTTDQTDQSAGDSVVAPTPERALENGPSVEGVGLVPQTAPPPEPQHSGWGSLVKDSAGDFSPSPNGAPPG